VDACDYVVYYYLLNPETQGWYVKGKGLNEPRPVGFETGKTLGAPRTTAWFNNLESIVLAAKPR